MREIFFFSIVQAFAGGVWAWMCVCRIMWMDRSTRSRVRIGTALSGAGAIALGLAPLVDEPYRAALNALAGLGVCASLWSKSYIWRGGVPHQFRRRRTDSEEPV